MQSPVLATASFGDTVGLPFLLSLFASIVAVVLLWAKEQWRLASRTQLYWQGGTDVPIGRATEVGSATSVRTGLA